MNTLYYGDNLDILRRYVKDESVDLVYLDPPFKSNQDYNVLFAERSGEGSAAQIKAFEDTWQWDQGAAAAYHEIVEHGPFRVSKAMQAFWTFLGPSDMMAYLSMMAPRLVELRRVLKSTGSIYLHCDPTASHYLKMLMDAIFAPQNFRNEITWKRSSAHSDTRQGMRRCGRIRDILLLYTKSEAYCWNPLYTPYTAEYLQSEYRHVTPGGRRFKETDLTAARPGGDVEYEWRVKRRLEKRSRWEADLDGEFLNPKRGFEYKAVVPYAGRFWAYSKENLIRFAKASQLIHRRTGMPRLIQFADEMPGIPLQDLWDDIPPASGSEDLGYPTQKPEALLERILKQSSDESSVVLDPFCGCGTAIVVAERLKRQWIGIDITHLAISLIRRRLRDTFGDALQSEVVGEPVSVPDAEALAKQDRFQFQWWALGLVGARPVDQKKGADQGIDGRLYFHDDPKDSTKQVVISVKSGGISAKDVRDLIGVVTREKAAIGALLTLEPPTKAMKRDAASLGFYQAPFGKKYARLQILTIKELLEGKTIQFPRENVTFKKATAHRPVKEIQIPLT